MLPAGFEFIPLVHGSATELSTLVKERLDEEGGTDRHSGHEGFEFEVIPLENKAAQELAEVIVELLAAGEKAARERGQLSCVFWLPPAWNAPPFKPDRSTHVFGDPRTNSILVVTPPETLVHAIDLVTSLDADVCDG